MTISISPINTATDSFTKLYTTVNQVINAVATATLTLNSNNTGNLSIIGTLSANSIVVGNTSSNIIILNPTVSQINAGTYYLNANGSWSSLSSSLSNNIITTTGTTTQVIDSFSMNTVHATEYLVNVNDNNANNHYTSKILISHDTVTAYITEWAQMTTNSTMGVFSASSNATSAILNFNPISTNTTVSFAKIKI